MTSWILFTFYYNLPSFLFSFPSFACIHFYLLSFSFFDFLFSSCFLFLKTCFSKELYQLYLSNSSASGVFFSPHLPINIFKKKFSFPEYHVLSTKFHLCKHSFLPPACLKNSSKICNHLSELLIGMTWSVFMWLFYEA